MNYITIQSRCNSMNLDCVHDDTGWWLIQSEPFGGIPNDYQLGQLWVIESVDPLSLSFSIRNYYTKVMDVPLAASTEVTDICLWDYNGGMNQQWRFVRVGGDLFDIDTLQYFIIVPRSGLTGQYVLDVPALSSEPGKRIHQWPYNGGLNQQWTIHYWNIT